MISFDLESVVIHARLHAGVARQNRQTDDAVADVAAVGVLLAGFVEGVAGHAFHAENRLIKLVDRGVIVGVHGDMANFGEHIFPPTRIQLIWL